MAKRIDDVHLVLYDGVLWPISGLTDEQAERVENELAAQDRRNAARWYLQDVAKIGVALIVIGSLLWAWFR